MHNDIVSPSQWRALLNCCRLHAQ